MQGSASNMYYVYILQSQKDGNLYVGSTSELKQRFAQHNKGGVISTKHRRPLILICYEAYQYKTEALIREKFLKTSDGKKDLKKRMTISLN